MEPHDIQKALSRLPTTAKDADAAFAKLAPFNHGGIFVGRFSRQTPWERHPQGDEFVHVLDGEVELTVLTEHEPVCVTLRAGSIFVVPQGLWHRQVAQTRTAALLSATPTPTDISAAKDPRGPKGT
jgi:quercetin dioxygenase-like cupin family protein